MSMTLTSTAILGESLTHTLTQPLPSLGTHKGVSRAVYELSVMSPKHLSGCSQTIYV